MEYRQEIGKLIKQHRIEKNLSQAALAEKSKVSESVIKRMESPSYTRTSSVSLDVLFKVSIALDIHINELIGPVWEDYKTRS